ncbi:MAG TPA: phytoene desaturase family protein [Chitinophagaceae bacterium]|nr:phytoene desaturase family protein [Chitinophagaceae bacterium]
MPKKVIIIGSGFAGLSAASFMAKEGWDVRVIEKHLTPGGRARRLQENGFSFDMGPSWYWMPDVFERYFQQFGKKVTDYYALQRLNPSYRVYWDNDTTDLPADYASLRQLFESIEPGAGRQLDLFIKEAAYKYAIGINKLVHKPGLSLAEFIDWDVISGFFRLNVFSSIKKHIARHFTHPRLRQLMEFPVLFLGALPEDTPALYSLMNYADIIGGTWYPQGGMYSVVNGMHQLAMELGVQFHFDETVQQIVLDSHAARKVVTDKNEYAADVVIGGADYHFIENNLLPEDHRSYSTAYWDKKLMAPSCLLYYVGIDKKLKDVRHHSLFFDVNFEQHAKEIYTTRTWPEDPLFYVSVSSVTDDTVAPPGHENLVFLVPVAAGLAGDTEQLRDHYFDQIIRRFEQRIGEPIKHSIVFKKTFAYTDFLREYNSFKGNAYGLANTLSQTAIFRPSCRSKKIKNLFYAGQLTVPGPGVPPSLISGEVAAREVLKHFT